MRKSTSVILIVAITFVGFVFYSLYRTEPVQVVESHLEHRGAAVFVDGRLRNTGGNLGAVDVEVRYFDAAGRTVGQDKIVIQEMKSGSEASFKTPPRSLGEVTDFSIYLNHGRNPYGN